MNVRTMTPLPVSLKPSVKPRFSAVSKPGLDTDFVDTLSVATDSRICQGGLHNCQLLAVIDTLRQSPAGRALILDTITAAPDKGLVVTFPRYPQHPVAITIEEVLPKPFIEAIPIILKRPLLDREQLPAWFRKWVDLIESKDLDPQEKASRLKQLTKRFTLPNISLGASAEPAVKILELAYAKLQKMLYPERYHQVPEEDVLSVYQQQDGYHYSPFKVFYDISKSPPIGSDDPRLLPDMLDWISQDEHAVAVASTNGQPFVNSPRGSNGQLKSWHVYGIHCVEPKKQRIMLRDPADTWETITLPIREFLEHFKSISWVSLPPIPRIIVNIPTASKDDRDA